MVSRTRYKILMISALIICAAAMIFGIARGEAVEIFYKGVTICLSCIGIG